MCAVAPPRFLRGSCRPLRRVPPGSAQAPAPWVLLEPCGSPGGDKQAGSRRAQQRRLGDHPSKLGQETLPQPWAQGRTCRDTQPWGSWGLEVLWLTEQLRGASGAALSQLPYGGPGRADRGAPDRGAPEDQGRTRTGAQETPPLVLPRPCADCASSAIPLVQALSHTGRRSSHFVEERTAGWGSLKQDKFILPQSWRQRSKLEVWAGPSPPGGFEGGPSCFSQLLVAPGVPWLVATALQRLPVSLWASAESVFPLLSQPISSIKEAPSSEPAGEGSKSE